MTGLSALNWLGRHARWVLAFGAVIALFLPGLSSFLRPALPFLVSSVLAMAMARMDIPGLLKAIMRPRRLVFLIVASIVLMPVSAVFYLGLARLFGLNSEITNSLIYLAAAPPIASAAGLCFLLGFNAVLAVELTLVAMILTPLIGVLSVNLLLSEPPMIAPLTMSLRIGGIIALGIFMALAIRFFVGAARIGRNGQIFDGLAALNMLIFVVPLFDGVLAIITGNPRRALLILGLGIILNFGVNLVTVLLAGKFTDAGNAGAYGMMNGNRTVAIYLAVIPADPAFILFVALYQFPMYLTPVFGGILKAAAKQRKH